MNGIGIVLGIFIAVAFMVLPIIKILLAKYISFLEKMIWFFVSILWLPIALFMDYPYDQAVKNATSQEEINQLISTHHESSFSLPIVVFWALLVFLIFKIVYTRREAIWQNENKKND